MKASTIIVYVDFDSLPPSNQHANQTPKRATPSSIRNTSPADFVTTKCFDNALYSQQPVTFVKEFNNDDVAQTFIYTLEKNIKKMYKKV